MAVVVLGEHDLERPGELHCPHSGAPAGFQWCGATRRGPAPGSGRRPHRRRRSRNTRTPARCRATLPGTRRAGRPDRATAPHGPRTTGADRDGSAGAACPHMLRNVIKEGGSEISNHEDDEHRGYRRRYRRAQRDRVHAILVYLKRANGGLVPTPGNPLATVFVAAALTFSASGPRIDGLRDAALSWHIPPRVDLIRGLRLCMDASRRSPLRIKVAREVMRTNPRIDAIDALLLGATVFAAARERKLAPQFLAATLLQESACRSVGGVGGGRGRNRAVHRTDRGGVRRRSVGSDPRSPVPRACSPRTCKTIATAPDPCAAALAAYNAVGPLRSRHTTGCSALP